MASDSISFLVLFIGITFVGFFFAQNAIDSYASFASSQEEQREAITERLDAEAAITEATYNTSNSTLQISLNNTGTEPIQIEQTTVLIDNTPISLDYTQIFERDGFRNVFFDTFEDGTVDSSAFVFSFDGNGANKTHTKIEDTERFSVSDSFAANIGDASGTEQTAKLPTKKSHDLSTIDEQVSLTFDAGAVQGFCESGASSAERSLSLKFSTQPNPDGAQTPASFTEFDRIDLCDKTSSSFFKEFITRPLPSSIQDNESVSIMFQVTTDDENDDVYIDNARLGVDNFGEFTGDKPCVESTVTVDGTPYSESRLFLNPAEQLAGDVTLNCSALKPPSRIKIITSQNVQLAEEVKTK